MKLLLASGNAGKLVELRRILAEQLAGAPIELVGLADVPPYLETPETAPTFTGNALAKARDGARHTGLPTVADDSGLAVDALNGMPGVLSARWSGHPGPRADRDQANLALVLAQLADVPDERRGAAFVCAAALVRPDGREYVLEGRVVGRITREPRGTGGFGYDPIFVPHGYEQTTAELAPAAKDAISHRGAALRALAKVIATEL